MEPNRDFQKKTQSTYNITKKLAPLRRVETPKQKRK